MPLIVLFCPLVCLWLHLIQCLFSFTLSPTDPPPPPPSVEADEIRRLSHSFNKLDLNKNGSLSVDEFLSIPELQQNPLVRRVIDILDTDRNGEVDFQGEPLPIELYMYSSAEDTTGNVCAYTLFIAVIGVSPALCMSIDHREV